VRGWEADLTQKKVSDLLQADSGWRDKIVDSAPMLMVIFANVVIIIADIRAYDVLNTLTGSWWKSAMAVVGGCAIPFIIWELSWQYNHTTEAWRTTSLFMAGFAFATSLFLGVADYTGWEGSWTSYLLAGVVIATGIHAVMGLLYYYNDPDVARRRHKAQALGAMEDQQLNAQVAEHLLKNGQGLLGMLAKLEEQYDPEDVAAVLRILDGKRKNAPTQKQMTLRPMRQFPKDVDFPTNPPRKQ